MNFESLRTPLATILEVAPDTLQKDSIFTDFEQWDSFARLSVVALVTEHTGKQITIDDMEQLVTIDDLEILIRALKEGPP